MSTKKIVLPSKMEVFIDKEDWPLVKPYKWYHIKLGNNIYARTTSQDKSTLYMHRLIMGNTDLIVDHIDGNGLNNRKKNLRLCTAKDNAKNAKVRGKSSKYIGVRRQNDKRWIVSISIDGKSKHIGCFQDELEAAYAYNDAAIATGNEFYRLNDLPKRTKPKKKKPIRINGLLTYNY